MYLPVVLQSLLKGQTWSLDCGGSNLGPHMPQICKARALPQNYIPSYLFTWFAFVHICTYMVGEWVNIE